MPAPAADVRTVFATYPPKARKRLKELRAIILETAATLEPVGPITETLKWGEPAYLTEASKSGSTIRIGWKQSVPDQVAMYFNCQTTLVDSFRTLFPELEFVGNRALVFAQHEALPTESIAQCVEMALTYHLSKKRSRGR